MSVENIDVSDALPRSSKNGRRHEIQRVVLANAVEHNQQADREMRDTLRAQFKKLEVREDGLLDLAADHEINSAKLKERLRTVALERGSLQQRLERTEADLERERSPNNVRRQLLDAFFEELRADITDGMHVEGVEKAPIAMLPQGARSLRDSQAQTAADVVKRKNPRLRQGPLICTLTSAHSEILLNTFFE